MLGAVLHPDGCSMSEFPICVTTKNLSVAGETLVVEVLKLASGDHMTVAQVAEMLSVTTQNIRALVARHGLVATAGSDQNITELRRLGVIPIKTTVVNLLPKATIRALVKIVDTPEAWAAYSQLWADAGELKEVRAASSSQLDHLQAQLRTLTSSSLALIDVVRTVETKVDEQAANGKLTSTQCTDLMAAMKAKAAALGKWPMPKRGVSHTQMWCNRMMGLIKRHFIPAGMVAQFTWKEISQRDYPAALQLIQHTTVADAWNVPGQSITARPKGGR
jgi:hypothetical protein